MQFRAIAAILSLLVLVGCGPSYGPKARYGITFYSPGAGNVDFGDNGLRTGLEQAGYQGQVATNMWTVSFNPAIDQALRINALAGARKLAGWIEDYADKYPGKPINLVGLSAGTGVTIWALERLKPGYQVDNVILLASSLSNNYDTTKALGHVRGKVYNYYSSNDAVLQIPMKLFGTIDGKFGVDGAGAVGLKGNRTSQVVNIRWKPDFRRYGYHGGHTDGTSPGFVKAVLSQHFTSERPRTTRATRTAGATRVATSDPARSN